MNRRFVWLAGLLMMASPSLGADVHAVGVKAPPLDLEDVLQAPAGSRVTWDGLRGKVVVLEFWATWCPSCVKAIPHFNQLADELSGKPVVFIAVTDEKKQTVLPFLANHPIRGWVGLNPSGSMFGTYGIDDGRPLTVIVRPDGVVDARLRPWATPFPLKAQNLLNLIAGRPSGIVSSRVVYAGEVRDERDKAVAGVRVQAINRLTDDSWRQIGAATTDGNGRFIIDREIPPDYINAHSVCLDFKHPDFQHGRLEDLRLLPPEQQRRLRVCLRDGKSLMGRIIDAQGRAIPGATVQAVLAPQDDDRKHAITDGQGKFILRGLPSGGADLRVLALDAHSRPVRGHVGVDLAQAPPPAVITVSPALPPDRVVHELFGMKLVEVDKDLQARLLLEKPAGLLVVDPGRGPGQLGIDGIGRGDCILALGDDHPITTFSEFVRRLLTLSQVSPAKTQPTVTIEYWLDGVTVSQEWSGLKLSADQLAKLRGAALEEQVRNDAKR